jgi:hypothetical protein
MDWIVKAGERLGLEGKELREFIDRESERQINLEKLIIVKTEKEANLESIRAEEATKAAARAEELARNNEERNQRAEERALRKLEMECKLQQEKIQLQELQNAKAAVSGKVSEDSTRSARVPKLPFFTDRDELDAYLERYERFAKAQKWADDTWAINLSALLTGKALEVYSRLSADEAERYDCVKAALLKRYHLTEEGFRLKFRESKPEQGESARQFTTRLSNYLDRWMEMGKVEKTLPALRSLIVREQFLVTCNKQLSTFIKERSPKSVDEMTDLAEY